MAKNFGLEGLGKEGAVPLFLAQLPRASADTRPKGVCKQAKPAAFGSERSRLLCQSTASRPYLGLPARGEEASDVNPTKANV